MQIGYLNKNIYKPCALVLIEESKSESTKETEKLGIPLFVLPPTSAKTKGNAERMNRIITEEFLRDALEDFFVVLRVELRRFIEKYNAFSLFSIKSILGELHSASYVTN